MAMKWISEIIFNSPVKMTLMPAKSNLDEKRNFLNNKWDWLPHQTKRVPALRSNSLLRNLNNNNRFKTINLIMKMIMVKMMMSHITLRMRSRLALSLSARNLTLHPISLYQTATLNLYVMMRTMMKMALNCQARHIQPLFFKVWSFNSISNNKCNKIRMMVLAQLAYFSSNRLR